jgi:hypothetical protein
MFPRPGFWASADGTLQTNPNGWTGGITVLDTNASGIVFEENGAGGVTLFDAGGTGGIVLNSSGGRLHANCTAGYIFLSVPAADPHVIGALFTTAGVMHVSAG